MCFNNEFLYIVVANLMIWNNMVPQIVDNLRQIVLLNQLEGFEYENIKVELQEKRLNRKEVL